MNVANKSFVDGIEGEPQCKFNSPGPYFFQPTDSSAIVLRPLPFLLMVLVLRLMDGFFLLMDKGSRHQD